MATNYGDNAGEADEDDIGQPESDPDLGDPNAVNNPTNPAGNNSNNDNDPADNEPDDGPDE
jgi:hypothetical protein